jgi:hypothetical protein
MDALRTTIELGNLREHINNNVVEQYYRQGPFSPHTIAGIVQAGHLLLKQIDTAGGRVKFNKGTLQTWLLYSLWAPAETGPIPPTLLHDFELTRTALRKGQPNVGNAADALSSIVSLYDDRASYRVTDVSSVLSRDLAIHIFSLATFNTLPIRNSDTLLARLNKPSDEAFPAIITEYLAQSSWGNPFYGETR